jgi:uncharacterized protein
LGSFWGVYEYLNEGRTWLGTFLSPSAVVEQTVVRAKALIATGNLAYRVCDIASARLLFMEDIAMEIITFPIEKPDATNFILGQTHFIKSVEDLHEALVNAVPGIKFGLAFCEASGDCLVRWSGTDPASIELAQRNALTLAAGHSFIIFLGQGYYPINVLNAIKLVPEVCRIFCATANPTEVIIAESAQGRGILGVVDGFSPKGVEDEAGITWRKSLLRQIGYKG